MSIVCAPLCELFLELLNCFSQMTVMTVVLLFLLYFIYPYFSVVSERKTTDLTMLLMTEVLIVTTS